MWLWEAMRKFFWSGFVTFQCVGMSKSIFLTQAPFLEDIEYQVSADGLWLGRKRTALRDWGHACLSLVRNWLGNNALFWWIDLVKKHWEKSNRWCYQVYWMSIHLIIVLPELKTRQRIFTNSYQYYQCPPKSRDEPRWMKFLSC